MEPEKLVEITRGPLLECFQIGSIAIVDESGLRLSAGDVTFVSYYRSSSKPIQILPLYPLEIDTKYGLTDEELSIMSGSLACSPRQLYRQAPGPDPDAAGNGRLSGGLLESGEPGAAGDPPIHIGVHRCAQRRNQIGRAHV